MKHIKAFTYEPKIAAVKAKTCKQTIRPLGSQPVKKGDTVLFHGWEDRPYRSPWSWRLEVEVTEALDITIHKWGVQYKEEELLWDSPELDKLAKQDGISPPTGETLGELFNSMYDLYHGGKFQIIRWK